jgi:hypothetical protein
MRFELTTSTLARLRSTPELRPHINHLKFVIAIVEKNANNSHPDLLCKLDFIKGPFFKI